MDIAPLLGIIDELPGYRRLVEALQQKRGNPGAVVPDTAKPYFIAALHRSLRRPLMVVTAQPEAAKQLYEQLLAWHPSSQVKLLPEPDALPYERIASDPTTELERLRTLYALTGDSSPLIVTSALAVAWKTVPYQDFISSRHIIEVGTNIDPLHLLRRWEAFGYRMEGIVEVPGTMSRRGGIVDIYPPDIEMPVRLEFFGDTVESLRFFDPADQRSQTMVSSIVIGPATEVLMGGQPESAVSGIDISGCNPEAREQFQQDIALLRSRQRPSDMQFYTPMFNTDSLLSYLPPGTRLILDEPREIQLALDTLDTEAVQLRQDKLQRGELPDNFPTPYLTRGELGLANRQHLALSAWGDKEPDYVLDLAPAPGYSGQLPLFIDKLKRLADGRERVIIVSHQASRLSELLNEEDIIASPIAEIKEIPPPGSLTMVNGLLAGGWAVNDTHLFTDAEIFGFTKQRRPTAKRAVSHRQLLIEIAPMDYVVHIEHGIARFAGTTTMSNNGTRREYLVLQYAAGDNLYVPTDQIDRVSRYIGASDRPPSLSRLGTQEWTRARERVKESVADVARELLTLYAAREVVTGYAFSPDLLWQQELESSFPYVETPDQIRAIAEVKEDMARYRPMDRLVSGDVGYGKTEVAVRAAFKAVMDGKQVALLVPTTVLAQQHFTTFKLRLKAFPVRVEVLSRFRTPKEQQAIIEGLAAGTVDICIGTHRLLQKDVIFKDLGLLIIDEEQRFGVSHKEHFKRLRQEVDVLTLSATPIPRTLHMSLVGVRDMSTMETPPEDRLPIKTYVAGYDDHLVREAILRELERNGQVFFVHNRVQGIGLIAKKLHQIVPEAKITIAHGQMHESELERVMTGFASGESDVLVCTTIIESGLDMPNVNTLIVNRADRFGLTQLYQLRGRIGRGSNLAFAYFLYDRSKSLTPGASKRLQTIYQATELGMGFDIALKDLEIRGAGTLLGMRQSGHISAVGFSLYTRLLAEAVEAAKAKQGGVIRPVPPPPATVDLPLPTYLPDGYVADIDSRLHLYQNLANISTTEQIDDLAQELIDRFGTMPIEVENLLYAVRVKVLASRAGIESVATEEGQIALRLFRGMQFTPKQRLQSYPDGVIIYPSQVRINLKRLGKKWQQVLEEVLKGVGG
ncbi:transcription-repair coupling factor [Chloroflexota bacterium]